MQIVLRKMSPETAEWFKKACLDDIPERPSRPALARGLCEREGWLDFRGEPRSASARKLLPELALSLEAPPLGVVGREPSSARLANIGLVVYNQRPSILPGVRFGSHNVHENWPGPSFCSEETIVGTFLSAGIRVYDLKNPYQPEFIAYFVPLGLENSRVPTIQLNEVYVDENGIVYCGDRWAGGLYNPEMDI